MSQDLQDALGELLAEGTGPDWLAEDTAGALDATPDTVARLRAFVLDRWLERAAELGLPEPQDLSGACKFNALLVKVLFGGEVRGSYDHLYNVVGGRVVDLSEGAADVMGMADPYGHDPSHFSRNLTLYEQLDSCLPRVARWARAFHGMEAADEPAPRGRGP